MNEVIKHEKIENMIYEIKGVQVMLDSDLAKLYECKNGTKTINQKELFDILRNIDKKIIIISKNIGEILIKKYSKQYSNIKIINNYIFHDRYIILDRKIVYVSGMSLKDLGKKYSYIYRMNEKLFTNNLIEIVKDII